MKQNNYKKLDQFYTNPLVSQKLLRLLQEVIADVFNYHFLEPSAGTGIFLEALKKFRVPQNQITAYDLDPKNSMIQQGDYLKLDIDYSSTRIIIGNPPFGKRGKLALTFLNKALSEAKYVAFILSNIFNRYSIQKQVSQDAQLIFANSYYQKIHSSWIRSLSC